MARSTHMPGCGLTASDFHTLEVSWITQELAERARLRRVTSAEGAAIVGRNGRGDYAGLLFPYVLPGQNQVREFRLRRDNPDYERGRNGELKEKAKYLSPPGRANLLYFVPGTPAAWLNDTGLPVAILEGEKKTLAVWRLSLHGTDLPRLLPIGLSGVWNWRGLVGKTTGPKGERRGVKGPIADLERIVWAKRRVFIVFDADVRTNQSVAAARNQLSWELSGRGAEVYWVGVPEAEGTKGIDELLAHQGAETTLSLFEQATRFQQTFNNTDCGNAERLVANCGNNIRYCHLWKKWLHWDGTRWVIDESGEIARLAKATVRSIYREAATIEDEGSRKATAKWARESEKASRIEAMIRLAQSEQDIPVHPDELDRDSWFLNCANGTIDFATGELRPHRQEDMITKLAPVDYDAAAKCPRWLRFLKEIFERHLDIIPFIQRAVGYSLTGDTREECLFLLWGTGRNGKGTFIKTVANALGDYAATADFSAFIQSRNDRGPRDDVANMKGKRFISAQEAREGVALAESLIKWLTGGDRVRARRLYENSSEFDPTHKIWLATNHKPAIRGTDPAIWSRIKLIPFEVSFEGREDKTLKETLQGELPGILTWAVEGCLQWQREGLSFPESVINATRDYRQECDQVGRFIEECCELDPHNREKARGLYKGYRKWAEETGEKLFSEKTFGSRITERFPKEHKETGWVYAGISLKQDYLDYDARVSSNGGFSGG